MYWIHLTNSTTSVGRAGAHTGAMLTSTDCVCTGRSVNRVGIYKVKMAFREAEKWLQLIFYQLFYSASVKEDKFVDFFRGSVRLVF